MKRYYTFRQNFRNSVIEIKPNKPYKDVEPFLVISSLTKLKDDVRFHVVKGKKWTDLIYYNEAAFIFFVSERLINIFAPLMDISKSCYPIKFEENETTPTYYILYNVQKYTYVNPNSFFEKYEEVTYFYLPEGEIPPALFTIEETNMYIIDEKTKNLMKKLKITNIAFEEIYALNSEEYEEWKILHAQHKPLIPRL